VTVALRFGVALLALAGCGPREVDFGDPCSPGDGYAPSAEMPGFWLACSGPPGCEGPREGWQWGRGDSAAGVHDANVWCGCDGNTGSTPLDRADVTQPPVVPWRWIGTCEPELRCRGVQWTDDGWLYASLWGPVAPECTQCELARIEDDGSCMHPSGVTLQPECCSCLGADLDADGRCTSGEYPVSSDCCE